MEKTKKNSSASMKVIKRLLLVLLSCIVVLLLVVAIYVSVITAKYYRVGNTDITPTYNTENTNASSLLNIDMNKEYTALTYNIGFGAYSPEFTFFMDGGTGSRAKDINTVVYNTQGVAKVINETNADFAFLQEVDLNATRSKYQNQVALMNAKLNSNFEVTYTSNFHVPYLMYPVFNPIGLAESGLTTFSKYSSSFVYRYELPVDTAWPFKLFDLDRCYSVNKIKTDNNKELVLVNVHLTAFENRGIREKQLAELKTFLLEEKEKGNYIVMGGDFNHDLWVSFVGDYNTDDKYRPSWLPSKEKITIEETWIEYLNKEFIDFLSVNDFSFEIPKNEPTCRTSQFSYNKETSRTWVIDGFIISNNIKVTANSVMVVDNAIVSNIENFMYSDHNPVIIKFTLK